MQQWSKGHWLLAAALSILLLSIVGYICYVWHSVDLIWLFFSILGLEISFYVLVTCCLRQTHYLHMHHYNWSMLCITILGV